MNTNTNNLTNIYDVKIDGNKNNGETNEITQNLKNVTFNKDAKPFVPRKNKSNENDNQNENQKEKLNFNLEAKEYVPKTNSNNLYQAHEEPQDDEELANEELDMIVNDLVENEAYEEYEDEEESDDEKWFPKYKECECCKGFIYKCKGSACTNMGVCYCKMKDECDDEN